MAAAGLLLVLLLSLSSSGNDLGGTYTLWKPRFWGPRLARADDGASPFLASQLPLKPLVTTPVDILQASSTPVPVGGRQALTVRRTAPAIATGPPPAGVPEQDCPPSDSSKEVEGVGGCVACAGRLLAPRHCPGR